MKKIRRKIKKTISVEHIFVDNSMDFQNPCGFGTHEKSSESTVIFVNKRGFR